MPKTIYTPRDELVCGKLDEIGELLSTLGRFKRNTESVVPIIERLKDVRHDVERMELKLISRKQEAESMEKLEEKIPAGWRFYTADNSILDRCSVMLIRDPKGVEWWNSLGEEVQEETDLFISGSGSSLMEAIDAAWAGRITARLNQRP